MSEETTTVVSLADFKAARANGGWRAVQVRCVACSHLMVAVAPAGSSLPSCSRCNGAVARELTATRPDGTEDPQIEHRRYLIGLLEDTLAAVVAGHVDGAFIIEHRSDTHPSGCAWAPAFTGNVDLVHQLGALELLKADVLKRAGL